MKNILDTAALSLAEEQRSSRYIILEKSLYYDKKRIN